MKNFIKGTFDFRLFFVVFFLILNPSINFFSIPLKIGFIIGFCSLFYLHKDDFRFIYPLIKFIGFSLVFILFFIVRALFFEHDIFHFITIYLNFIAFLFIAISLSKYFTFESFLYYVIITVFINSLIIILEFLLPDIKIVIESILYQDYNGNISYALHDFRFRGLALGGGAALGLVNLLVILCIINIKNFSLVGFIIVFVIYISTFFISRSSLIFGSIFFIVYLLYFFINSNNKLFIIFFGIVISFIVYQMFIYYLSSFEFNMNWFFWAFDWAENYLETGEFEFTNSSVDQLSEQTSFDFSLAGILVGNGFFSGNSFWLIQSDSGYWRLFNSIGIGALIFYLLYAFIILKYLNFNLFVKVLFIVTLMVFEYKEPVLIQNYSFRFLALILVINYRNSCSRT